MVTEIEETQAKEFLKRAEIRTMKKDLRALREGDALKERDKIAKIRTLEEQLEEKQRADADVSAREEAEKAGMEEVLQKNASQERIAEKDLKNYANEQERQQIFLLESERVGFEKQVDAIDKEKDPTLKLEKNKLLLQKRDQEAKLNSILEQEKKLEDEQKFVSEKSQTTAVPSEKKSLEQRRWDIEQEIQNIEKKRWESEKQVQGTDEKIKQADKSLEQLVIEKNSLKNKILGIDKSLRDIYSAVIARFEEKRRGEAKEQVARKEILSKARAEENEKAQREQWGGLVVPKKKLAKSFEAEQEQRKKFLQDVEQGTNK